MNVTFLAVNSSYSHSSLAAWCLRSMVTDPAVFWHQVDATVNDDPAAVAERVRESNPDVLAVTLYLFNRGFVQEVLARCRIVMPGCLIVAGGPECLGDNRALATGSVDIAVRGEGEIPFARLLERLREPSAWKGISGLCGVMQGIYRDNGMADTVERLEEIPNFYPAMLADFSKPFVQLETSRGCPNGCLFCTSRRTGVRYKSLERVRTELAAIRAAGVRTVRLVDRTFNLVSRRSLELLRLFRDEFPEVRFHLEIDPGLIPEDVAEAFRLAPAGTLHLEVGVQSLEGGVHPVIQRRATPDETLGGVRCLAAMQTLELHADLMAGLPGQTWAGLVADVGELMRTRVAEIQLERLKLLPGTPLAETPETWGLVGSALPPYQVLETPDMPADALRQADHLARVLDWFYNKPLLRDIFSDGAGECEGYLVAFITHCSAIVSGGMCPGLETRLRLMDSFWAGRSERMRNRVRYLWAKSGLSLRDGLAPAALWKGAIPESAVLLEGNAQATFSRIWRVELDVPHYFCFGTGEKGERAVLAVFREG